MATVFRNHLYVFGGEFTSPNQERFHHYKARGGWVRQAGCQARGIDRNAVLLLVAVGTARWWPCLFRIPLRPFGSKGRR